MSYCRFSSDGFQSDVYVYESDNGFVISVAQYSLSIAFGLSAGFIMGALCFVAINMLFALSQPSWQCFRCKTYFQNSEVKSVAP